MMHVQTVSVLLARLGHERHRAVLFEGDLAQHLLDADDTIARRDRGGGIEVELDLPGRGLVVPSLDRYAAPVESLTRRLLGARPGAGARPRPILRHLGLPVGGLWQRRLWRGHERGRGDHAGRVGDGEVKKKLAAAINRFLEPMRERRADILDTKLLHEQLGQLEDARRK